MMQKACDMIKGAWQVFVGAVCFFLLLMMAVCGVEKLEFKDDKDTNNQV